MLSSRIKLANFLASTVLFSGAIASAGNAELVSHEIEAERPTDACDEFPLATCETPIERYRKSFYQGTELLGGYLLDTGDRAGGLNQSFEEVRASFGLPLGSMDNLLGFQPYFRADNLNGPTTIDLPATLYNTGVNILNQKKWTDAFSSTWSSLLRCEAISRRATKAIRIFALAVVNWQARSDLSLSLGVVYFDRQDFNLLPAVGATWTPTPWWRVDATMPRPRIARRLVARG